MHVLLRFTLEHLLSQQGGEVLVSVGLHPSSVLKFHFFKDNFSSGIFYAPNDVTLVSSKSRRRPLYNYKAIKIRPY